MSEQEMEREFNSSHEYHEFDFEPRHMKKNYSKSGRNDNNAALKLLFLSL